jgi:hypothetical protein
MQQFFGLLNQKVADQSLFFLHKVTNKDAHRLSTSYPSGLFLRVSCERFALRND